MGIEARGGVNSHRKPACHQAGSFRPDVLAPNVENNICKSELMWPTYFKWNWSKCHVATFLLIFSPFVNATFLSSRKLFYANVVFTLIYDHLKRRKRRILSKNVFLSLSLLLVHFERNNIARICLMFERDFCSLLENDFKPKQKYKRSVTEDLRPCYYLSNSNFFKKNCQPRPLFRLFSVFSNKKYNF